MDKTNKPASDQMIQDMASLAQYVSGLKFMSDRLSEIMIRYTELYDEAKRLETDLEKFVKEHQ